MRLHPAKRLRAIAGSIWFVGIYLFLLAPLVVVMAAFSATSYLSVPPKGLTLRWFLQVLGDPAYLSAIWYSLVLATLAAIGSLVIGTAAAYGLARRQVPGAQLISAILMSPLIFPGVVAGFLLAFVLSLDDFVITNFVGGQTSTFPTWVYGATRIGVPPQVNVWGTLLFGAGLAAASINLVSSIRKGRKQAAAIGGGVVKATSS